MFGGQLDLNETYVTTHFGVTLGSLNSRISPVRLPNLVISVDVHYI